MSPYSVRMRENTDQKNSEQGHFSRSDHQRRCQDPQKYFRLRYLKQKLTAKKR